MKQFVFKFNLIVSMFILLTVQKLNAHSNQYLDFDGVDDYVSVPNGSVDIAGSTAFSVKAGSM